MFRTLLTLFLFVLCSSPSLSASVPLAVHHGAAAGAIHRRGPSSNKPLLHSTHGELSASPEVRASHSTGDIELSKSSTSSHSVNHPSQQELPPKSPTPINEPSLIVPSPPLDTSGRSGLPMQSLPPTQVVAAPVLSDLEVRADKFQPKDDHPTSSDDEVPKLNSEETQVEIDGVSLLAKVSSNSNPMDLQELAAFREAESFDHEMSDYRNVDNTTLWCDEDLGCLNVTSDWYSFYRPVNSVPNTRKEINTKFYLHTRTHPAEHQDLMIVAYNKSTVLASTFDSTKPIKFIIHGFINSGDTHWLKTFAQSLLTYGDYNVFRVDWGGGSRALYSQAVANTRVVGLEIGYLVNWLIAEYDVKPADVHLLGHSLGAHIGGYAGEQIKGLGRITGLDPAGPFYTHTPEMVRLDPSDAVFVDAIHTDGSPIYTLGYGTSQPMGDVDFYPNGGVNQPGCDALKASIMDISVDYDAQMTSRSLIACNHHRAIELFQESLSMEACRFLSHECTSYEDYQNGACSTCSLNTLDSSSCQVMGIEASRPRNSVGHREKYYLETDAHTPYCQEHYTVTLVTGTHSTARDWVIGELKLSLEDDQGNRIKNQPISEYHRIIQHNSTELFEFRSHVKLGTVVRADLKWSYNQELLNTDTYCTLLCDRNLYVNSVTVVPTSYYPEVEQKKYTQVFCRDEGSTFKVKDRDSTTVYPSPSCS